MIGKTTSRLVLTACVAVLALQIAVPPTCAQAEETAGSVGERTHLLGDWGGVRTRLAARGIIVDIHATQFYQGVVSGSAGTSDWQYGVKADYMVTVLGEKAGLWKGLLLNFHAETRAGDDVNTISGLSPANVNMLYPNSKTTTSLTQAIAIQMLDQQHGILVGKVNGLDLMDMVIHSGRGIDGFMNTSLVFPLGLAGTLPLALPAAGVLRFKGKEIQGAAVVYDNNDCATTSCLDPFFEDPSVVGVWKFFTGSPHEGVPEGYVAVGGSWTSKKLTVISPSSFIFNPGEGLVGFEDKQQSWSVFSVIDQPLWSDPSDPNRTLRFKGMYTLTDGKAFPVKWTATAALEMGSPFPRRAKDTFGIGYFHNELAGGFKTAVGAILSLEETLVSGVPTRINVLDTDGFEAYYKAQLTPWFALTGDVQVITETLSDEDTKVVTGVRGKVTF